MIKATDKTFEGYDETGKMRVKVSLSSDTSAEVSGTSGDGIEGLGAGYVMTLGSTCLTSTGDFGILDSNGTWHF